MFVLGNRPFRALAATALLTGGLALPVICQAALGDDVASIEHDRVAFAGQTQVTPQLTYEVHEITTAAGHVREYVGAGRVFAVSWDGSSHPDLTQLLGAHLASFQARVQPQPGNHHMVSIADATLVVSIHRLPRGVEGHVLVPSLVPSGVALAALR